MVNQIEDALRAAEVQRDQYLEDLIDFVAIPSVSTDPKFEKGMHEASQWLQAHLKSSGFEHTRIIQTRGAPVVFGEQVKEAEDRITVLIYGHYDVQPPDPLDLWRSDPFEPVVRDGSLFGRGVSDMKGQIMASLSAIKAIKNRGDLPVNIKCLFEGEEEIGSPNLASFIKENRELLSCDLVLNLDGGMLGPDSPTIQYSLRGLFYFTIMMKGPATDLHSGMFGGAVVNPANELARLIGGMLDPDGRITLPGFYDSVIDMSLEERKELARLPFEDSLLIELTEAPALFGEKGYTSVERIGGRPSLDVHGILSGYTGEGEKTIIPSKAVAKISIRLVPNQEPDEVYGQLEQYLEENASPGITWEITSKKGTPPSITPRDSIGVQALSKALRKVWGKTPLFDRAGGSVPVVYQVESILGVDTVMTGFGLPDDNLHAPNEKLTLEPWYKGISALIYFFHYLADFG